MPYKFSIYRQHCACMQELAASNAVCRRNGAWKTVKVTDLVVGDLIQLKGGDVIPADARVSLFSATIVHFVEDVMSSSENHLSQACHGKTREHKGSRRGAFNASIFAVWLQVMLRPALQLVGDSEPLKVDEASLTGESIAVQKSTGDNVLSGAVVEQGESEALITAVGENTFFGKTIKLLSRPEQKGHLQKVATIVQDYL